MDKTAWTNEFDCENTIRELLCEKIIPLCEDSRIEIYTMKNKGIADIIICRNGDCPKLFLLEVKYYKYENGRLGVGDGKGESIQVEILVERPKIFEDNMRWILFQEGDPHFYVLTNDDCQLYASGKGFS